MRLHAIHISEQTHLPKLLALSLLPLLFELCALASADAQQMALAEDDGNREVIYQKVEGACQYGQVRASDVAVLTQIDSKQHHALVERIETRHGLRQLSYMNGEGGWRSKYFGTTEQSSLNIDPFRPSDRT